MNSQVLLVIILVGVSAFSLPIPSKEGHSLKAENVATNTEKLSVKEENKDMVVETPVEAPKLNVSNYVSTGIALNTAPATDKSAPMVDVSVCVPCIPRDLSVLERLLKSIAAQTARPREVIIALSDTSPEKGAEWQNNLSKVYPVTVVATEGQAFAGENRNRAAERASGRFVTFMDADDIMHPQKLEIMASAMEETGSKCMLHSFTLSTDEAAMSDMQATFTWKEAKLVRGQEIYHHVLQNDGTEVVQVKPEGLKVSSQYNGRGPHHGHATCTKDSFDQVKFTNRQRAQDVEFLRGILARFPNDDQSLMFLDLPLTMYFPSDHQDNAIFQGKV